MGLALENCNHPALIRGYRYVGSVDRSVFEMKQPGQPAQRQADHFKLEKH
jgi:hypothetical protein